MIPVEVGEPSTRRLRFQQQQNKENMKVELETTNKFQERARIREETTKLQASRRYNTKVQPRAFQPGDLVWRVRSEAKNDPRAGKLGPQLGRPIQGHNKPRQIEHIDYRNWMAKQFQEHGTLPI